VTTDSLAALPCVLAVEALLRGHASVGALLPHQALEADALLQALSQDVATLHVDTLATAGSSG
jgi:hypothetical protein